MISIDISGLHMMPSIYSLIFNLPHCPLGNYMCFLGETSCSWLWSHWISAKQNPSRNSLIIHRLCSNVLLFEGPIKVYTVPGFKELIIQRGRWDRHSDASHSQRRTTAPSLLFLSIPSLFSLSNAITCVWAQLLRCVQFLTTPWTKACQAPRAHGILPARMLEWVAISSFRGSSWPRGHTHVSWVSCVGKQTLNPWATWGAMLLLTSTVLLFSTAARSPVASTTAPKSISLLCLCRCLQISSPG